MSSMTATQNTPEAGRVVVVVELPTCDFCSASARYDFKIITGPWAHGCERHYGMYRAGDHLGVGMAQRLITADEVGK